MNKPSKYKVGDIVSIRAPKEWHEDCWHKALILITEIESKTHYIVKNLDTLPTVKDRSRGFWKGSLVYSWGKVVKKHSELAKILYG
jgi:hypothetical protein